MDLHFYSPQSTDVLTDRPGSLNMHDRTGFSQLYVDKAVLGLLTLTYIYVQKFLRNFSKSHRFCIYNPLVS
jgi:hypothetical protein